MMTKKNWEGVKRLTAELMKESIWMCCSVKPTQKPILLFSSRRSGSTMLAEAIAANTGVIAMNQPFATYSASPTQLKHMLPFLQPHGQLISPCNETKKEILAYFDLLLQGKLIVNAPWRCWNSSFRVQSNRIAFKILAAKGMIETLAAHSGGQVLYSTRHPISQSISLMRNNWGLTVEAYLQNLRFIEKELTSKQYDLSMDILSSHNKLNHYVLNWVLENLIPLRRIGQHPEWLYIDYESCVLQPEKALHKLQSHLTLVDTENMKKSMLTPSQSTKKSSTNETKEKINVKDRQYLVNRWHKDVSKEEERQAMSILESFGIDIYRFSEDLACNH